MQFKLSNVILKVPTHMESYPNMFFRNNGLLDYKDSDSSLAFDGTLNFLTYYGALSVSKWKKYTIAESFKLHMELVGSACDISFVGVREDAVRGDDKRKISHGEKSNRSFLPVESIKLGDVFRFQGSTDYQVIELAIPDEDMLLLGFEIETHDVTAIKNVYWYTEVSDEAIRDIDIAVVTTTYKNEDFILPNIGLIHDEVLQSDEPVGDNLHLFVIDNGNTLNSYELTDSDVTVVPNPNIGGSGGFARGMIEALNADRNFTHVLLMDDDVRVFPESFIRTYNLLALSNSEYADAFINGAMLQLEFPNIQFEDVSHVVKSGVYRNLKCDLAMDHVEDIAVNEAIDVEVPNAYGAWWYSCIPVSAVREYGLPLPIFVRCDDVEYGLRCGAKYMTMAGICVWHSAFDDRYRASVDGYQYMRNFPITMSVSSEMSLMPHMLRAVRTILLFIRSLDYTTAEQILSGLEDFMKGPDFIREPRGEEILRANNSKCEKLVPMNDALAEALEQHPELGNDLLCFTPDKQMLRTDVPKPITDFMRLFRTLPYDKHILPDFLLSDKPGTVHQGTASSLPGVDQVARKVLVACNREGTLGTVRIMDKEREREIRNRLITVFLDYVKSNSQIRKSYREAFPELVSIEFWKEYIDKAAEKKSE